MLVVSDEGLSEFSKTSGPTNEFFLQIIRFVHVINFN
jgi:hypothetical protein